MIHKLRRLFGHEDKFLNLLEASAVEARNGVQLLAGLIKHPDQVKDLNEFAQSRRRAKLTTEEISEALCKTFVTPLEREDIEALAVALYRIPKTGGKFGERFLLCHNRLSNVDFSPQLDLITQAAATVVDMVARLRQRDHLGKVKELNEHLHQLESQADRVMSELVKDLYNGAHDPLRVIIILDLHELLERIVDRCRDAGNVVFQIVLKCS